MPRKGTLEYENWLEKFQKRQTSQFIGRPFAIPLEDHSFILIHGGNENPATMICTNCGISGIFNSETKAIRAKYYTMPCKVL